MAAIKDYLTHTFRHFNAGTLIKAAEAWKKHIDQGGKMFLTMGGAMSTAELGVVLAELIRRDYIHGMAVTGANLEEDIFNLVARNEYESVPDWRELTAEQDKALFDRGMNRVTDVCIPEENAMTKVDLILLKLWQESDKNGESNPPHEYIYRAIRRGLLEPEYQIDPKNSWMVAACEKNLPIFVPGWEDSTLGNTLVAYFRQKKFSRLNIIRSGLEQMDALVDWYQNTDEKARVGFFQIGGGITGDFAVCVVPLIMQDLKLKCRTWGYFCQISEASTSYGSYSGAPPDEKISWNKLDVDTPKFVIESDATIVFPLIAAYLLDL